MDRLVIESLTRWPDVPAAYGWLSLDARGRWCLHAQGQAAQGGAGESIGNAHLVAFIQRNYAHDENGCWFFQNGPQRVYVRIDGAPLVLRRDDSGDALRAHTDTPIDAVQSWWLDEVGHLYAQTRQGPGIVLDRDLQAVLDSLHLDSGEPLLDVLDTPAWPLSDSLMLYAAHYGVSPLHMASRAEIPRLLGFQANPISPL